VQLIESISAATHLYVLSFVLEYFIVLHICFSVCQGLVLYWLIVELKWYYVIIEPMWPLCSFHNCHLTNKGVYIIQLTN